MTQATTTTGPHSLQAAAEVLAVTPRTLLRWIQDGDVSAERLGDGRTSPYFITSAELARVGAERAAALRARADRIEAALP